MGTHYQGQRHEVRALNAYIKLMRAADSVGKRLERHLSKFDLTENQFGILEILLHRGSVIQRELSEKLFTSGGNVTQILDQLERRELVKRIRDSQDRRNVQVHLTAKGEQFIRDIFPVHLEAIMGEFCVLTAEEQEELARLCKKIGLRLPQAGTSRGDP